MVRPWETLEVKTTDAYRINLDVIGGYRDELIQSGKITSNSSVLLIVGRQDTGDLEAQVRGSRHAWAIRIISAEALAKLVTLKESTELASAAKIHELLIPFEYTRLDKIIDIAFTVAEEASEGVEEPVQGNGGANSDSPKQRHTPTEVIEQVPSEIVTVLSAKYCPLVKKSRALYWTVDKSVRVAVTISKVYDDGGFWFAHHPQWDMFLSEAVTGLLVLGCIGRGEAYAIPYLWIHGELNSLYVTERTDHKYWHLVLEPDATGCLELRLRNGGGELLDKFKLPLTTPAAASA